MTVLIRIAAGLFLVASLRGHRHRPRADRAGGDPTRVAREVRRL